MSAPSSPSWYDLLGVEPTADQAQIRSAWKTAIGDLDPTDRRFRAYNQAAEVLLDPARRAEYDAALSPPAADAGPQVDDDEVVPQAPEHDPGKPLDRSTAVTEPEVGDAAPSRTVPLWLLLGLAVLTLALSAGAAYLSTTPSDAAVADATQAAQSSAERAIVPILSYDHRTLEEDQAAARRHMTADYRPEYDQLFEVLKQNAPRTKTVVEVEVIESGIVRSGEDRVEVLLFVDRPTTNKQQKTPVVYKDHVRVQMENVDGDWLVDCLITSPGASCD